MFFLLNLSFTFSFRWEEQGKAQQGFKKKKAETWLGSQGWDVETGGKEVKYSPGSMVAGFAL